MVYRSLLIFGAMTSLSFIESLQKLHFLIFPAKILSFLGNEEFFLLLLPFVYWAIDRKTGARLGILLLFSAALNDILKVGFALPRPYWIEPSLALSYENSFGFPSGHAQNAALLWTFLSLRSKNPKLWVPLALLLALSIAFSRLVLGVHFPADAFGGAFIGFALLGIWLWRGEKIVEKWRKLSPPPAILLSFALIALLGALYCLAFSHPLNGGSAGNDERFYSTAIYEAYIGKGIVSRAGALFGLLVGLTLAQKLDFEAAGSVTQKIARLLVGFLGLAVFYFGLKLVFPDILVFRFLRYALTTFWVVYGAPQVFLKVRLTPQKSTEVLRR